MDARQAKITKENLFTVGFELTSLGFGNRRFIALASMPLINERLQDN